MNRLNRVRNIVDSYIEKIEVEPGKDLLAIKRNEYTHSYGVASLARLLAMKRGLDSEIAAMIGHLHDIGRILYNLVDESHGPIGAIEAEKILWGTLQFNEDEISVIGKAIQNHSQKDNVGNAYDELIKDADLLERYLWDSRYFQGEVNTKRLANIMAEIGLKRESA